MMVAHRSSPKPNWVTAIGSAPYGTFLHAYLSEIGYHKQYSESFGQNSWCLDTRNDSEPIFRLKLQWGSQKPPQGTYRVDCLGSLHKYNWLPTLSDILNSATDLNSPQS